MISLNDSDFADALRFVADATGKEIVALANKYALQTIIGSKGIEGAMQRTPKADRAKIQSLDDKVISGYIARKLRRAGKLKTTTTAQFKAFVRFERQRRARAAGYTAFIGWTPAAKQFGGTGARGKGKTQIDEKQFSRSEAKHGGGSKATLGHATAEFWNTAPEAEEIGTDALQAALDAQTADMLEYGTRKLQEMFDEVSARK